MSFETWVSILLASIAVLLAIVTLIVAIAGIAIALVGIWGLKAMRKAAEQKAHIAVTQAISEYPDAAQFIEVHTRMKELYRLMRQQMADFKQEFEVLHQRSEAASAILDRLDTKPDMQASNIAVDDHQVADSSVEPMSESYPGEEANFNDDSNGKSTADQTGDSSHAR